MTDGNSFGVSMSNVRVIYALYRAFAARDYDGFKALCHPDIVWIQNAGFPSGGRFVGPETVVREVFKRFEDDWSEWRFEADEYMDAGRSVIVIGSYHGRHRRSGKVFRAAAAHVYDLKDGKLSRYRQFTDTRVIAEATC